MVFYIADLHRFFKKANNTFVHRPLSTIIFNKQIRNPAACQAGFASLTRDTESAESFFTRSEKLIG